MTLMTMSYKERNTLYDCMVMFVMFMFQCIQLVKTTYGWFI